MAEETLDSLKSKYDNILSSQLEQVVADLKGIRTDMSRIEIRLAELNLVELKKDVNESKTLLTKYDLPAIYEKVEKHERWGTRVAAILAFIQIAVGVTIAVMNYLKH